MWSWYRSEFVLPLIVEWKGYKGDGVLPVQAHGKVFTTKMYKAQGNECHHYKAICEGGKLEDLCAFCSKSLERFAKPNTRCVFAYDKGGGHYGWNDDDVAQLCSGIELPALALCSGIERDGFSLPNVGINRMSFNLARIMRNLEMMDRSVPIYQVVKNDPSTNFFATRTITPRPHSMDAWFIKIKKLQRKLSKLNTSDPRLRTLEV